MPEPEPPASAPRLAGGVPPQNRHGVAVIIGNKDYRTPDVPDVSFAHRDAKAIKRYVIGTLGFRERNVIDLRDATQTEIERAFGNERSHKGELWRLLREGKSDVVVFYSGHGMPGLKDGESYLLPVNVRASDVEISGYPLRVLYDNLRKLRARSVLVLIDACFSGGSHGGTLVPAGSGIEVSARKVTDVPAELTVLTAAGPRQIASWDLDAEHGLFTSYFLKGIAGAADGKDYGDGNRQVTVAEIKRYLDDEMTYAAKRRFGREQNATLKGDHTRVLASIAPVQRTVTPEPVPTTSIGKPAAATPSVPAPDAIAEVQRRLAALGYRPGPADGIMGRRTRDAAAQFQRSAGLPATGQISDGLLASLRKAKP